MENKEQEWAEKFEELDRRLKEVSNKKPRRRNWFVRTLRWM